LDAFARRVPVRFWQPVLRAQAEQVLRGSTGCSAAVASRTHSILHQCRQQRLQQQLAGWVQAQRSEPKVMLVQSQRPEPKVMLVQSQRPEPMVVLVPVQLLWGLLQQGQVPVQPGRRQATSFRAAHVQPTLASQALPQPRLCNR